MKPLPLLTCLFFLIGQASEIFAQAPKQSTVKSRPGTYKNPLPVAFGDPYVLYVKGDKYYMYGTGAGAKHGFSAYSSTDLVNWNNEGQVYFGNNKNGWGSIDKTWDGAYWAPEVYQVKGKFYLFYSAQWKNNPTNELENFRIGVAVSDKPTGPFVDISDKPVLTRVIPLLMPMCSLTPVENCTSITRGAAINTRSKAK
jgi:beta-xylosidase